MTVVLSWLKEHARRILAVLVYEDYWSVLRCGSYGLI